MGNAVNIEENFSRMRAILEEREKEYDARESEFKERRSAFILLEEKLASDKKEIDARESALLEKDEMLQKSFADLEARTRAMQEAEEALKQDKAEFETEKSNAYLQVKIEAEELKNERIRVRRQSEQLEYEKGIGKIGMEVIQVKDDVISDEELKKNYILRSEVEEDYILRSRHEEEVAELKETNQALLEAKTQLFRKMFGKDEKGESEQLQQSERPEPVKEEPKQETQPTAEEEKLPETARDLTAQSLKDALLEQTEFSAPQIKHADVCDLVEAKRGEATCCFVFDEPPYFDIMWNKKAGRKLLAVIEKMKTTHPDVDVTNENGEIRATGYFLRSISAPVLLEEVAEIISALQGEG